MHLFVHRACDEPTGENAVIAGSQNKQKYAVAGLNLSGGTTGVPPAGCTLALRSELDVLFDRRLIEAAVHGVPCQKKRVHVSQHSFRFSLNCSPAVFDAGWSRSARLSAHRTSMRLSELVGALIQHFKNEAHCLRRQVPGLILKT